jgi:hypothetical protein
MKAGEQKKEGSGEKKKGEGQEEKVVQFFNLREGK